MVGLISSAAGKWRTLITQLVVPTCLPANCRLTCSLSILQCRSACRKAHYHSPTSASQMWNWTLEQQWHWILWYHINLLLSRVDIWECAEVNVYVANSLQYASVTEWHIFVLAKGCARLVFGWKWEMGSVEEGGSSCHRRHSVNERNMCEEVKITQLSL